MGIAELNSKLSAHLFVWGCSFKLTELDFFILQNVVQVHCFRLVLLYFQKQRKSNLQSSSLNRPSCLMWQRTWQIPHLKVLLFTLFPYAYSSVLSYLEVHVNCNNAVLWFLLGEILFMANLYIFISKGREMMITYITSFLRSKAPTLGHNFINLLLSSFKYNGLQYWNIFTWYIEIYLLMRSHLNNYVKYNFYLTPSVTKLLQIINLNLNVQF